MLSFSAVFFFFFGGGEGGGVKYDLGQRYYARHVRSDWGSNS